MHEAQMKNANLVQILTPKPPADPERKPVTFTIKPEIWTLLGQWSEQTGYSRGEIIERMVAEVQKQQLEAA